VQLCGMVNHKEVNGVCAVVQQRGYDENLGHYYKLLLNGRAKAIKIKAANVSAVDKSLLRWTTYVDSEGDRTQIRLATSGERLEKRVNFDNATLKVVTKLELVEKDSSVGDCQTLYWDVRDQDGYGGRIALRGQDAPAILNRLKTLKKAAFGSEAAHRGKSDPHSEPQHRSALQALPPAELPNGGVPMKGWSEESAAGWVTAVLKVPDDVATYVREVFVDECVDGANLLKRMKKPAGMQRLLEAAYGAIAEAAANAAGDISEEILRKAAALRPDAAAAAVEALLAANGDREAAVPAEPEPEKAAASHLAQAEDTTNAVNLTACGPQTVHTEPCKPVDFVLEVWAHVCPLPQDVGTQKAQLATKPASMGLWYGAAVTVMLQVPEGFGLPHGPQDTFVYRGTNTCAQFFVRCHGAGEGRHMFRAELSVERQLVATMLFHTEVKSIRGATSDSSAILIAELEQTASQKEKHKAYIDWRSAKAEQLLAEMDAAIEEENTARFAAAMDGVDQIGGYASVVMHRFAEVVLPLARASFLGRADMVEQMLMSIERGHRCLNKQHCGYSAYMFACEQGHVDIVRLLVQHGCKTAGGGAESTARAPRDGYDLARDAGRADVVAVLDTLYDDKQIDLKKSASGHDLAPHVQHVSSAEPDRIGIDCLTGWGCDDESDHDRNWRIIGKGAQGAVYRVERIHPMIEIEDRESDVVHRLGTAIVKCVHDDDGRPELEGEIKQLARLRHTHIVQMVGYTYGKLPSQPNRWMLLLEECDGDLTVPIYNKQYGQLYDGSVHQGRSWSDGPELSWERRCDFAQQMASGLVYIYIHEHKQVHHWDLKPGNILIKRRAEGEWVLKIADFGVGDGVPEDEAEPVGTPEYMAPEAWGGRPEAASDVFSFGLILWELCTQKRVHEGFPHFDLRSHTVAEHIPMWMATKDARPEIPAECSLPWALLTQACWAADPAKRPTFADIETALQAFEPVVADWAATVDDAAPVTDSSVQQWLEGLGLGSKLDVLEAYVGGAETVADEGFQEFAQGADDYIEEMVEEDDLTDDEGATLKQAMHAMAVLTESKQPAPESRADPWHELCAMFKIRSSLPVNIDEGAPLVESIVDDEDRRATA
jgi:serine/threonine protein kinase